MRIAPIALSVALAACAGRTAPPADAPSSRAAAEAGAVYAVLLDSIRQHPSAGPWMHRYVQVETRSGRGFFGFESNLRRVPEATPALQQAFFAANERVLDVRALSGREGMEWISRDSLDAITRRLLENDGVMQEPFTATRFTAVGFSEDGGTALLYVDYWCGLRCGEGYWALLTRQPDGRWMLRRTLQTVVS